MNHWGAGFKGNQQLKTRYSFETPWGSSTLRVLHHAALAELLVLLLLSKQPRTKHPKKQLQTQPTLFYQAKKYICLKDQINEVIPYASTHEAK